MSIRTHGVTVIVVGSLSFEGDNHLEVAGSILTGVSSCQSNNTGIPNTCTRFWLTDNPHGFNKGRSSKFREGSRVRQTPEKGRRTYRPKRCGNNDEDNSPKTLNDKNHQASSQKFRQLIFIETCTLFCKYL